MKMDEGSEANDNKAGYTATLVACGWAGAVLEKVTRASGQKPYAQKAKKRRKVKAGCRVAKHATKKLFFLNV